MVKSTEKLIDVKLCSTCKLYKFKCEGMSGAKGIQMSFCPFIVKNNAIVPENVKIPFPIPVKKARKSK